jgi:hypothetical protein
VFRLLRSGIVPLSWLFAKFLKRKNCTWWDKHLTQCWSWVITVHTTYRTFRLTRLLMLLGTSPVKLFLSNRLQKTQRRSTIATTICWKKHVALILTWFQGLWCHQAQQGYDQIIDCCQIIWWRSAK